VIHDLPLGGGVKLLTERYSCNWHADIRGVIFMFTATTRANERGGAERKENETKKFYADEFTVIC